MNNITRFADLRHKYALAAITGLIARGEHEHLARRAYETADLIMKELLDNPELWHRAADEYADYAKCYKLLFNN